MENGIENFNYKTEGFIQTLDFFNSNKYTFSSGDSKKYITGFDSRIEKNTFKILNDSMINILLNFLINYLGL
jgi:hypothetical protein